MTVSNSRRDANSSQWNFVLEEFEDSLLKIDEPATITLTVVYAPLFLLSLVGNVSVCIVVCRHHYMRKNKNYFLVNLSLADLLVTVICVPVTLASVIYQRWVYGTAICKLSAFFQGVAVAASIYSLTALSLDRYLAIKHPAIFRRASNHSNGLKLIGLIWLVSMLFMMPMLYVRQVDRHHIPEFSYELSMCIEVWSTESSKNAFAVFMLVATYVIPCSIIVYCHYIVCKTLNTSDMLRQDSDGSGEGKHVNRRRIAQMLVVLVLCFVACWLPYNLLSLYIDLTNNSTFSHILPFTLLLAHANSAVNPVLYWMLNSHFRAGFNGIFSCGWTSVYTAAKKSSSVQDPPKIVIQHVNESTRQENGGKTVTVGIGLGDSV